MTYVCYVTRIKNVRKHPNADRLQLGECFGNQVVVGLDVAEGELGLYFGTDGQLSPEFLKANNLVGVVDSVTGQRTGGFFDEKGRVRTQKFRKEKSDGYYCKLDSLKFTGDKYLTLKEGSVFNEIDGIKICQKYVTERTSSARGNVSKPVPKVKFPMFHEHIDTEQLCYNKNRFHMGQFIVITEKLHGTSGRSSYSQAVSFSSIALFINGLFKREVIAPKKEWAYVCGTRRVVIKDFERLNGYYKEDEIIRKTAHENFVGKLHKGETVYYEIVGYTPSGTIMPVVDNTKLGDKAFVKQYGKETTFHYGCPVGTADVYVYRMTMTNEDGVEVDYTMDQIEHRCDQMAVKSVPVISRGMLEFDDEQFLAYAERCAIGSSLLTPSHIREGVVVRIEGSKWEAYKHKSFEFKVLEGIIKDTGAVDTEEAQEMV